MAKCRYPDSMLYRFSCDTKRFGTVYYFLKPNNHGEGGILNYKYWDEMGCNGTKKDDFLEI